MKYDEFVLILTKLGYTKSYYTSGKCSFYNWRFYPKFDKLNIEVVQVSYVIDEFNKVRQQFGVNEVVKLHIKPFGYSGNWEYISFNKCINNIMSNRYCNIQYSREFKLNKLGI